MPFPLPLLRRYATSEGYAPGYKDAIAVVQDWRGGGDKCVSHEELQQLYFTSAGTLEGHYQRYKYDSVTYHAMRGMPLEL
jgi:hypothetical protein